MRVLPRVLNLFDFLKHVLYRLMKTQFTKFGLRVFLLLSFTNPILSLICTFIILIVIEKIAPDFVESVNFAFFGVRYEKIYAVGFFLIIFLMSLFQAFIVRISLKHGWLPKRKS